MNASYRKIRLIFTLLLFLSVGVYLIYDIFVVSSFEARRVVLFTFQWHFAFVSKLIA